jgi:hypothetical protein
MAVRPHATNFRRITVVSRFVGVITFGIPLTFPFLGRIPQTFAVILIGIWILTDLFVALWVLAFLFRKVDLRCPLCGVSGGIELGEGFVCPSCGPVKCRGWFKIRCGCKATSENRR